MRVLLAGGGTAGHTSPLLATADALRRLEPAVEITCLGTPRGLETRVVPEAGYPLELISPVPLPRKPNADFFKVPARLRAAVRETRAVLDRVRPDVVVGYGGYVSMPLYLAVRKGPVPLVIHEQNTVPGLANRAGARFARRVLVSFPDTPLRGAEYVGLPIRPMISGLDRAARRAEAREFFGLDPDRPTLLVTGGSQGARRL
ncbi:MAG TPA: glycosyltransferase, partial [Nocardioides sp.]|nr:glycosyltransferase [Nocardioides sp.]